jgi:hypothetical protein
MRAYYHMAVNLHREMEEILRQWERDERFDITITTW